MRALLEHILQDLADSPEELEIVQLNGAQTLIFEVRCAKDDLGKLIGKGGATITAIRNLLKAVALRNNQRVFVEVVE